MTEQDQIKYLANVIIVAHADNSLSPKETAAIEEIRTLIGAKKATLNAAMKAAQSGAFKPSLVGGFATQVSNTADMLYMCYVDGEFDAKEKSILIEFCKQVGLNQEQVNKMVKDAVIRSDQSTLKLKCPSCSIEITTASKFCPNCGHSIGKSESPPQTEEFAIPSQGYSVVFCESTSAGFPDALKTARTASNFQSIIKNKKTWYLAAWDESQFEKVIQLAQLLSGMRNRKAYRSGTEVPWDDLFGFIWCANERSTAYRPAEYCFGKDENQLNPWGCKQAQMDWTEWARWFSYGQFKRSGFLQGILVWVFDKERIKHELTTNLHRYRYCPFIRITLVSAILKALPEQVEIGSNKQWTYNRIYEETTGAIKVVETKKEDGYTYKDEYFADGIRPKGFDALKEILVMAFADARIADITVSQLIK